MSKYGILLALGIVAGATSIGAQTHPDFAGNWVLVHRDDARGEPLDPFGEVFGATQSSTNLTIDWQSTGPAGRGTWEAGLSTRSLDVPVRWCRVQRHDH